MRHVLAGEPQLVRELLGRQRRRRVEEVDDLWECVHVVWRRSVEYCSPQRVVELRFGDVGKLAGGAR